MRRGIIVEKNKKYVTLLTPDGQFLRTKYEQQDYEIGQEVTFPNESRLERKRAGFFDLLRLRPLNAGILSIAAIIVVIFTMMPSFSSQKAYAYMTIDINPSFELKLDHNYQVIGVTPLNQDAKQVLSSMKDLEKNDMAKVVQEIIDDCDKQGYVNHSKSIYISTVYENKQDHTYKTNVKSKINTISGEYQKRDYKLETVESDLETREKAQKAGISTGTYIRNQEMQDKDQEDVKKGDDDAEKDAVKEEEPKKDDAQDKDKDKEEIKTDDSEDMQPDQETPEGEDKEQKDAEREEQGAVQKPHQSKPDEDHHDKKIKEDKDHSFDKEQKKNHSTDLDPKKGSNDTSNRNAEKHEKKNGRGQKQPSGERKREHAKPKEKGTASSNRSNRFEHTYEQ
ncbi:anti-sigma-I factor RsgI family protein [Bacillus pumilus]|uniref:SigI regulator RsgI n=1 Tax=Bacillus pumilus TaxID=1408 RepID=A0AAD0HLL3_BACPU|nr:anti-sigma factor domain-containing protein [Bacillus pumilus]AVM23543.1 SigI regulator RsgI [Bacillus pumilus]TYS30801.1 anti-sigma factor domain-containing protein [Bacillus pumilus]TYS44238.1 anti-sigma factor domain-containing protein [Bacillus pumilus]TYS44908.1 anti-sigma factor domain-containing protein [Bacillus pumilus]